jgi:hypothetical protein
MPGVFAGSNAEQVAGAGSMIDLFLIFASVMIGVTTARLFELLFEVRYNQLQQILKEWFNGDHP